jgi:sialate O-acetylesterase
MKFVSIALAALPIVAPPVLSCVMTGISPRAAHAQTVNVSAEEKPFVHALFSDSMVLQRDRKINIWGWTAPGSRVSVTIGKDNIAAVAGADGKWTAQIGPMPAGGSHNIVIAPGATPAGAPRPQTVVLRDVMFGDVWLCSGQSNMEWQLNWGIDNKDQEIAAANHPGIRFFNVPNVTSGTPQSTLKGNWKVVSPQTVGGLTAVGYFFARELNQKTGIPIGLIDSSWGGTVAEAWVSEGSLRQMPDFVPQIETLKQAVAQQAGTRKTFEQQMDDWWQQNDPGVANGANWATTDVAAAEWKTMNAPGLWETQGLPDFNGLVWFRREVVIPEAWAGKELTLNLGQIDDRDTTFWNGAQVGAGNSVSPARSYKIPGNLVKAGRNVLAIRVLDNGGGGGFAAKPGDMKISLDANTSLSLDGPWNYRVANELSKLTPTPLKIEGNPNVTTVLYNAMIAPLIPYGIKGAIWYQGESNGSRGKQYQTLLPTLINDWRQQFGQGQFPFYIVQLANYMAPDTEPRDDGWPRLREAQLLTSQRVPNTGQAVIIDIGDEKDIHPRNKQDVGKRLALLALAKDYGKQVEYSGPVYQSMQREGNSLRLTFSHAEGMMAKGEKPTGFAIAGADKKFVWADARIEGNTIVVSSPQVTEPVAVRYAWSNNPAANLYNAAGLPASPFRTDNW